jgi:nucleoside-diphosphate-sugar epimerase
VKILIIGGNRFFGRHLTKELLKEGAAVTLLNRGKIEDGFGDRVSRLVADRTNESALREVLKDDRWDLVYDQVCYTAAEARSACRLFEGKTKRYVVTSSESIYDDGFDQKEANFVPGSFSFTRDADRDEDYQGAKRQVGLSNHIGPINFTTRGAISLKNLVSICEDAVGKKALLAAKEEGDNHSPYGGTGDKTMNTDILHSLGFNAPSSAEWFGDLVADIAASERKGMK